MKKMVLLVLLTAAAGGILFAQSTPTTTVSGTLGIHAGRIVVRSGTTIYYTSRLGRLVGFVDGFKDGAQVTMEGYASEPREGQTGRFFHPIKLTLNGKDYDLGPARTENREARKPLPPAVHMRFRNYLPPMPPPRPGRTMQRR